MPTRVIDKYGPDVGPSCTFKSRIVVDVMGETATQVQLACLHQLVVTAGSAGFLGTVVACSSNCNKDGVTRSTTATLNGAGYYQGATDLGDEAYDGLRYLGWVDRGTTLTFTASASYTSSSGAYYSSPVSASYTAPLNALTVYDASGKPRTAVGLWVYDASGKPRQASSVTVYDAGGKPRTVAV